jgi:hypothetical protein
MRDEDIDDILNQGATAPTPVDPAILNRIAGSIGDSLHPAHPLPPARLLVAGLVIGCIGVGSLGGIVLGLHGIDKMSAAEIGVIIPILGILIWLAAAVSVNQMIPGSRRLMAPWTSLAIACATLTAVFALLFHDWRSERFISQGIACLSAGLAIGIPAAFVSWLVLRRGFATNPRLAGFALGALAGLAGVSMLELHCKNFETLHVMVWHTAVLPLAGAAGVLVVYASRSLTKSRRREGS